MGRYDWNGYGPYVSKAEKIKKALKTREKMTKKGIVLEPVIVEGRTISRTWWGQSWIKNLERYADYSNRVPRGRSYLRNGSILDLKIGANKISALVLGSRSKPYKIDIAISSVNRSAQAALMKKSRESLDSMQSLLAGEFPSELKDRFFKEGSGLFPSPKEIKFDCSCPDWATMCKHIAAALYGVAVRLDSKPELFFTLRGIDINSFVISAAKEESKKLLRKAKAKGSRVLSSDESEDDIGELFGIALDTDDNPAPDNQSEKKKSGPNSRAAKKKASPKSPVKRKGTAKTEKTASAEPVKKSRKSAKKGAAKGAKKATRKGVPKGGAKKAAKKGTKKVTKKTAKKTAGL
ncbi:MAG: hypothetical protein ACLFVE_14875 [Chitinispirillaceae bacterium]